MPPYIRQDIMKVRHGLGGWLWIDAFDAGFA